MLSVEVKVNSLRYDNFDKEQNNIILAVHKYMIKEWREASRLRMTGQKQRVVIYYDSKSQVRGFEVGDTIIRQVFQFTQEWGVGKFVAK